MIEQKKHIGIRFPIQDIELLRQVCNDRGEDMSDFIRRATKKELAKLGYFDENQRKSLGVQHD